MRRPNFIRPLLSVIARQSDVTIAAFASHFGSDGWQGAPAEPVEAPGPPVVPLVVVSLLPQPTANVVAPRPAETNPRITMDKRICILLQPTRAQHTPDGAVNSTTNYHKRLHWLRP